MLLFKLFMALHVGLFRLTGGAVGGSFRGGTVLLLTTTGRKTGQARTVPVAYFLDSAGNPVICASKAGAPENPAWFNNLSAKADVTFQIGGDVKKARAEVAAQPLRDELWKQLTTKYKGFLDYEKKTTRIIPMVTLKAVA